jgi:hypothetical protein
MNRIRGRGFMGRRRGAFGEFGTLLRLVFGRAASAAAAYLDDFAPGGRHRGEDATASAALAAARCRREIAEAIAERERLVADILRYDKAREVLIAQEAAETDEAAREALARSLKTLEDQLTAWLDEHDDLGARIAELEADLAFFEAAAGETEQPTAKPSTATQPDPHLAALGLTAMPATLAELKAAYRARLKAVHPDVGPQASTDDAARATVAYAELRKRFPNGG